MGWPFGDKKDGTTAVVEQSVVQAPPPPEILFPEAEVPECLLAFEEQRRYDELAKQLGFTPPALISAQLTEFFSQENIEICNLAQVYDWLKMKKKEAGTTHWCWRPLRRQDVMEDYRWGYSSSSSTYSDGFYDSRQTGCRPYDQLVPFHALAKVSKLEAKFGDKVCFFVSDYSSPTPPDPFIMVRPRTKTYGATMEFSHIFDWWEEPGFGEFEAIESK